MTWSLVFLVLGLIPSAAAAQESRQESQDEESPEEPSEFGASTGSDDGAPFTARAVAATSPETATPTEATSRVTRTQREERLPRSAPDALRYEPGVYIQQTAHGQASPFVRGMTGQQVVHVFDGIRMNNGIYRQGPNQYFFTIDSRTIEDIEVQRGSASVRYGSDALGGAILARPRTGFLDAEGEGVVMTPRGFFRFASADLEVGGRGEVEGRFADHTAFLAGVGYRSVSRLESGGVVDHLTDPGGTGRGSVAPWVPRFEEEAENPTDPSAWRHQLGTGFNELTFDLRVDHAIAPKVTVTGAVYGYHQSDAPRTDQCPPPEAPLGECLTIANQNRNLAYLALRGDPSDDFRDLELILSWQNHHEVRRKDRPRSFVRFDSTDDVDTLGLLFRAATPAATFLEDGALLVRYGLDAYRDGVSSTSSQSFTDIDATFDLSRGQYIEGSHYVNSGLFGELEMTLTRWLFLHGGARFAAVGVSSPGDAASSTAALSNDYGAVVGRAGVELRPSDALGIYLNWDQGFRAPNLDDLTSRQQAGPGFQFENPDLAPERTNAFELGFLLDVDWLRLEGWGFATLLDDAMIRAVRDASDCPPSAPECGSSRNQYQLVNADGVATILGAEGGATTYLPGDLTLRATVSYAIGEAPNTGSRPGDPTADQARVPLSRIPPLNGTVEARWRHLPTGIYAGAALRWAAEQTRLAPSDLSDPRIPLGGTAAYGVFDLRAGIRWSSHVRVSVVFENVFDAAYRTHGSSVNGAGRGLMAEVMLGL